MRMLRVPEHWVSDVDLMSDGLKILCCERQGRFLRGDQLSVRCVEFLAKRARASCAGGVCKLSLDGDGGATSFYRREGYEDSAARRLIAQDGVGDVQGVRDDEIDAAIEATKVNEVQRILRLAGRHFGVVGVIQAQSQDVLRTVTESFCDVQREWDIAAVVGAQMLSVQPHVGDLHGALKLEVDDAVLPCGVRNEVLCIPARSLKIAAGAGVERFQADCVRQVDL